MDLVTFQGIDSDKWQFGVLEDGTPYVVGDAFCRSFGYNSASDAVRMLDHDEFGLHLVQTIDERGFVTRREKIVIYEDGIWELTFRSKLPGAKAMKKRVKEILKEIRKTGNYIGSIINLYVLDKPSKWEKMFEEWTKAEAKRLKIPYPILIRKLVYEKVLPVGTIEEIDKKNPPKYHDGGRQYKQHQFLTEIKGKPELREKLEGIKVIIQSSRTKEELNMFMKNYSVNSQKAIGA